MMCDCKDCKIVCDGKEIATITCSGDGFTVKCTDECKEMFHKHHKEGHEGCCK